MASKSMRSSMGKLSSDNKSEATSRTGDSENEANADFDDDDNQDDRQNGNKELVNCLENIFSTVQDSMMDDSAMRMNFNVKTLKKQRNGRKNSEDIDDQI